MEFHEDGECIVTRGGFCLFSHFLLDFYTDKGSGHNKCTRRGPTLCRGRGAMQDTTCLISQMDNIYWPQKLS